MKNKIYTILILPFFLGACTFFNQPKGEKKEVTTVVELTPLEAKLQEADKLVKARNYQEAYKLYGEAQNEIEDYKLYQNIQLKIVALLFEMQNYSGALAALAPMPEVPSNLIDCKKMALASQILDKMNSKPEYVESLLEVALENSIDEEGTIPFKAAAYAQLGRVYIKNDKIARAIKAFEYASQLYYKCGNKEDARACENIVEYLK